MKFAEFRASVVQNSPPPALDHSLSALWWEAKGDWHKAHQCAQADEGANGAWVHAYLHRREGDLSNAAHWYRRAGKKPAEGDLGAEWEAIARVLLSQG